MRRLSSAAIEAADPETVYRQLATELLTGFDVDQVHLSRVAQDHSHARARVFRPGPEGAGSTRSTCWICRAARACARW